MPVARAGSKTSGRTPAMRSGCSPRIRGPRPSPCFRWPWPSVPTPRCSAWWTACSYRPVTVPGEFRDIFPLPPKADRAEQCRNSPSYPDFLDYQARGRAVADFIADGAATGVTLNVNGANELVPMEMVSENYFPVLGVRAAVGRMLGGKRRPLRRRAASDAELLALATEFRRGGRYRWQDHHASIPAGLCRRSGAARLSGAEPTPDFPTTRGAPMSAASLLGQGLSRSH